MPFTFDTYILNDIILLIGCGNYLILEPVGIRVNELNLHSINQYPMHIGGSIQFAYFAI